MSMSDHYRRCVIGHWVDLALGLARERFGGGLAQVVELVRQGSLFTSSNGERSLETNT